MLSGCSVVEGDARYLVTAVGKNSEWGKILSELDTDRPDTPLQVQFVEYLLRFRVMAVLLRFARVASPQRQVKLGTVAENIGKLGLAVATVCFVAQTIIWLVGLGQEVRVAALQLCPATANFDAR